MANDEEETVLENQLEHQLHEQKDSIVTINEALSFDPTNAELLEVHEELVQSIKQAEDVLFHMKRARLLREIDLALPRSSEISEDVKIEPLDPTDIGTEPLKEKDQSYPRGSNCRFRHTDGRWYNGEIVSYDDSHSANISFLAPTTEKMLICQFFLQQRCRFGTNCRLSHGVDVPISSLKKYIPTIWEQSLVGSSIWASSENHGGIWKEAELKSWDDNLSMAEVVFQDDGRSAKLGTEAISLSEYAQMSEEEEEGSDSGSDQSDCSDYEEESPQGVGFLESSSLQRGIQTETAIFATWENHTRGIASKMMANMGFREGMGLGAAGQGMVNPIPVRVLPHKQSLEHALKSMEGGHEKTDNKKKKQHRGGKRKRDQKFAAMVRAKKQQEESSPDVFSLINAQLTAHAEALNGGLAKKQQRKDAIEKKKPDRRALVGYDDKINELRIQVERFEEMSNRNKKEKVVYEAAMRKLSQTREALAEAEAVHESASNALNNKEKEKKWLKF